MKYYFSLVFIAICIQVSGQSKLTGKVVDSKDKSPIIGTTLKLENSFKTYNAVANEKGNFSISNINKGEYTLTISSIGYTSLNKVLKISDKNLNLGTIPLNITSTITEEVIVKGKQTRVEINGDTTAFNADAYKVNPDATAEDLLRKMPGMELENGEVKAQGESVKKVLIDGKEFFGEDPSLALKNLPSEIIQKIEVFDRQSDQSQFSGFDDGNTEKTINIVTKTGKSNGEFGKIYGGYGLDNKYSAGFNLNSFKGDTRLSFIGMSNNVNQQNFASEDLLGALGSTGSSRRGGGRRGGRGGGNSGTDPSNFLTNGLSGISKTNAFGLNFIDKWGEKLEINASYFYNGINNTAIDTLERTTFIDSSTQQYYNENSESTTKNLNHRLNTRITYSINKNNSIILTPSISFQDNDLTSIFTGNTVSSENLNINNIKSDQGSEQTAFNLRGNLTYRHRFEKRGRTFSIGVGTNTKNTNGSGNLVSDNQTFSPSINQQFISQINNYESNTAGNSFRIDYTEPLGERSQLRFSYNVNRNKSISDKKTYDLDSLTELHSTINNILSNSFTNYYTTHKEGISYRYSKRREMSISFNLNFQQAILSSEQTYPVNVFTKEQFNSILPFAMFRYNISKSKNLRIYYRTSTQAPSITQLQNIINNTNPLQLSSGNPNLDQEYSHVFTTRYNSTNVENATSFYAYLNGGITNNNISNSVFTASKDTLINNVTLASGSQFTMPINYKKAWYMSSFMTYGLPVSLIKSNVNLNVGVNYNQSPSLSNDLENIAETLSFRSGIVVGSNISEYIDFTGSYNGSYSIIKNSLNPDLNSNYYTQTLGLKLNLLSKSGFLLEANANNISYKGLGDGFDQNFTLLNMSAGKKFKMGELKLTAYDLLKQNTSISRTTNSNYIEDSNSLVLTRYFLLTFTHTIRNFR